jgi:hypothetical protein
VSNWIAAWYLGTGGGEATAEQIALAVWQYSDRTLTGTQADAIAAIPDIPTTPPLDATATQSAAAAALVEYGAATGAEVGAVEALSAATAIGNHIIDYANSTATQYDAAGNVIAVFDLLDEDGNPANSASTAVNRVRRP